MEIIKDIIKVVLKKRSIDFNNKDVETLYNNYLRNKKEECCGGEKALLVLSNEILFLEKSKDECKNPC